MTSEHICREQITALKSDKTDALVHLIDATAYLGMQELPFRGHDERQDSANKGNYKELVE